MWRGQSFVWHSYPQYVVPQQQLNTAFSKQQEHWKVIVFRIMMGLSAEKWPTALSG